MLEGKMRKIFAMVLFICSSMFLAVFVVFAADITAESHLTQVSVYPDSALLTRSASIELAPGEHAVIFSDIIPELDENTIRVSGQGSAKVKILGAQVKKEFLKEKPGERVQELEKQIEETQMARRENEETLNILSQEREFLSSLRFFSQGQLPKDLITKVPSATEIDGILKFLDVSMKSNYAQNRTLENAIRDIDRKLEALLRELYEINTPDKMKRSIIVEVQVLKAGNLDLIVTYLVPGASWQSLYDARASFEKGEVELVSYGLVRQQTGEDWPGIDMVLSTARPTRGGRMPELFSWFLRPYQPVQAMRKAKASFAMAGEAVSSAADYAPYYLESNIGGKEMEEKALEAPAEVSYATAQDKGASVVYKIPRKASVKADGSAVRLPVFAQTLAAKFKYAAYPKANPLAYLASRVTNSKDLQLLPGRVNLFLNDDFVGASRIDSIAPGEDFDFYLGVDESVKVKREEIEHKMDDVLLGGIPSPNRIVTMKYKLTVENYKSNKITVELFESMPVSGDEKIRVKIENVSVEPKNKDFKDKKGVWRWEMELEPKAKKEISYTLVVEYPRNLIVEGL
jgi:uncharacterized protein (TIGR02231 family)